MCSHAHSLHAKIAFLSRQIPLLPSHAKFILSILERTTIEEPCVVCILSSAACSPFNALSHPKTDTILINC